MKAFNFKVSPGNLDDITPGELASRLDTLSRMGVTLADVKAAVNAIDQQALKTQTLNRLSVMLWEEGDLINGIDLRNHPNADLRAQMVRNLDAGGNIYLVFIDGRLVYNQWHIRNEGVSPIPSARLQDVVDEHTRSIAQDLFVEALRTAVLKNL